LASPIRVVLVAFAFTLSLARCNGDTSADQHRANLDDFLMPGVGYCPWSGRIVGER
jgi:hypothetical protein